MFKDKLNFILKSQQRKTLEGSAVIGPQCSLRVDIPLNGSSRLYCADDLIKFTGKEKTLLPFLFSSQLGQWFPNFSSLHS